LESFATISCESFVFAMVLSFYHDFNERLDL
jgi:hypothetical protein